MNFRNLAIVFVIVAIMVFLNLGVIVSAQPFGANVLNVSAPQRGTASSAGNSSAFAGNISELSIFGASITGTWQGYYGNVSGTIQLADASNNILYNWTLASPTGEVYSSTNNTISWSNIQCLNYTANGTQGGTAGETAGATSKGGINLTELESRYNIGATDADGINETFYLKDHDQFFTASLQFSVDECQSTRVYSASGPVDQQFEEVLLYEPNTRSVVFASLLEQDLTGFNAGTKDFEMLVLEDGHSGNTATTTYFFYVELA